MADYSAKIKLVVDGLQALKQVEDRLKNLNRLAAVDIGKAISGGKSFSKFKQEVDGVAESFSRLGKIVRGAAVGTGIGALTASVNGLSQAATALKFGGISKFAAALAAATGPAASLFKEVSNLAIQFPVVAGTTAVAGAALLAFSPQVLKAANATTRLAKAAAEAGQPISRLFASLAQSGFRVDLFIDAADAVKLYKERLFELSETVSVLSKRQNTLQATLDRFNSKSETAAKIAVKLVDVTRRLNREQQAQNDLLRKAAGLQPQDVRDAEVARRIALLKSREIQQNKNLQLQNQINKELADYEKLVVEVAEQTKQWANNLDRIARSSRAGVFGSRSQIQSRLQEFRENRASADIARERSAELLARERRLAGSQYSIGQVPIRGELFPGGRSETASPQFRSLLNEQARVRQAASEALLKSEKTITGLQAQTLRTEQNITAQKRIQQQEDQRSINILRERNKILLEGFRAEQRVASGTLDPASLRANRLRRVREGRERQKALAERTSNIALGAGFPLLFGGGAGAVIGGGLGGALGAGPQALAAQIGLSALGQILDQFAASAVELSAALNPLTLDIEKLIPALGATNTETAEYLRKLDELGRQDEALAVATEELAKIVGFDGVRALRDYGDAVVSLSNEWSKLITQLQAGLAGLLEGPVRFLAGSLERFNLLRQARTSTDPRIQLLFAQAQNTIRVPGKLKSLGVPDDRERIEEQIVKLQRENNQEAEKRAQLEQEKSGSFEQQLRLLTAQTELAALGNDLTKQAVFEQQKLIIQKERELAIQEAQGDAEKIAIADARARLSLQQLRSDRLEAQLDAEKRLTDEYERQRRKLEELDKKRKDQLNTAKEDYVLLLQDIDIQTATTDQAKAQAEYDKQRIERGYRYSKLYADALSSSERIVLASAQELEILLSKVELEKELEKIALKKAELLNKPTGLEAIQDETELLLNRINGREKEYLIEKKIQELIKQGIAPDIAENEVRTNANLKTQAELVEKQKKLWADIYTTVTGNITSAVEGLIAGTQTWGELLSNILGSLGTLFLNQGFSVLGTSLGLTGFAEGGFVTGPTRALIGEGGESEYVIPASKMKSAMNRYASGARGNAVLSGGDETSGGGTATMAPAAIDVRYNVERINNVDYVTNQEFQAGLQQAASQGAERGQQLALRRLQQSVTTRRRLGI